MLQDVLPPWPKSNATTGSVLYLDHGHTRPSVNFHNAATGEFTATYSPHRVIMNDARMLAPNLDKRGFALLSHRSAVPDFWDEEAVGTTGRAEAAAIVKAATGATHVHVFDHTLRRRAPDAPRQPSTRVHNDYTPASALHRVGDLLGEDEADAPFAFINVWRPVNHPAADWPLALIDATTVSPEDLVATDIEYTGRHGEIFHVRHNLRHRWYYVPAMQLDEVLLIKCADTRPGRAQLAPHTAFASPLTPPEAPPRESVEFRTIAFFPQTQPARSDPSAKQRLSRSPNQPIFNPVRATGLWR